MINMIRDFSPSPRGSVVLVCEDLARGISVATTGRLIRSHHWVPKAADIRKRLMRSSSKTLRFFLEKCC